MSSATSSPSTAPPATPPALDTDIAGEESKIAKAKMLDELTESGPLARLQREMEEAANSDDETAHPETAAVDGKAGADAGSPNVAEGVKDATGVASGTTTPPGSPTRARKPLLNPHDHELTRVSNVSFRHRMSERG